MAQLQHYVCCEYHKDGISDRVAILKFLMLKH